ncbi:hypothetical protein [Actinoplanes couchii]|uniref:Lipoprotein n=1 Tax=Actinoplanes couchii TaxID=403638 RepID=A0ABQ3X206_9ACTN|nr:hypothetical protein [Actinoplanes couchii]MDR6316944.1 hypothetical protein [Actinoplanes couchii]GID52552.1 hypothetical protein Aco03nite_009560 [Actinoplanes couchii]
MRTRTLLTVTTVLLLAGCSGPGAESVPEVASLRTASAAPTGTTAGAPVIRPDSTSADVRRMQQPWMRCLKEQGLPTTTTEDGLLDLTATGNTKETNGRIMSAQPEIEKACGGLRPVLAPELDEDRNPYWADDNDDYHECLVEAGLDYVKKNGEWEPGPSWYTDSQAPDEATELGCQAKAFDGRKG